MAKLSFCFSAMSGGKSSAALQSTYNFRRHGFPVFLIKSSIDVRGGSTIISRNGLSHEVDLLADGEQNLYFHIQSHLDQNPALKLVVVDEAQFLAPRQVEQLLEVTVKLETSVKCYGIRTDYLAKAFPGSVRLFELASELIQLADVLDNVCECGSDNPIFNARTINGKFTAQEGDQIAIDGEGGVSYTALCPECYLEKVGLQETVYI